MLEQKQIRECMISLQDTLDYLRDRLNELDEPAIRLYNASIDDDLHNLFVKSWGELHYLERDEWRYKAAGIAPPKGHINLSGVPVKTAGIYDDD